MAMVFGLLGGVLGAVGSIAQGNAAANAAQYNSEVLKQEATQRREAAAARAKDYRRDEHRKLMAGEAALGASGVVPDAGSPLLVTDATVREIALGSARYGYEGQVEATRLENQAKLEHQQAGYDKTAGYLGAGSSLLSGFGSMYNSWS